MVKLTTHQKRRTGFLPTVEQIQSDRITRLSNQYWAPYLPDHLRKSFDIQVVNDVYKEELVNTKYSIRRIMMLEYSQYLENYLWPNYNPSTANHGYLMSIISMVNEKFRERVPAWLCIRKNPMQFGALITQLTHSLLDEDVTVFEQTRLLVFLIHCFNSIELDIVREQIQRFISLPIWQHLLKGKREELFRQFPKLQRFWKVVQKRDQTAEATVQERSAFERSFLVRLIEKFFVILNSIKLGDAGEQHKIHYCERFLELMIDLESGLSSRRFFNAVFNDKKVVIRCNMSQLPKTPQGHLFSELLEMLSFYSGFEINDQTGEALTPRDMTDMHYERITSLQRVAFSKYPDLRKFALSNVASVDTREKLLKQFKPLSRELLHEIAANLNLVASPEEGEVEFVEKNMLLELLVSCNERRLSQLEELNAMPLYPTEKIIWDEDVVPNEYFSGEGCLALSKLNLQFLTLHDYLLRNFNLFRLESTYEIRQDIEDCVYRLKPWCVENGGTIFGGWARSALPINDFSVIEVAKPKIGENHPAHVRADVTVQLNLRREMAQEWEALRKHDVCFLITVRPVAPYGYRFRFDQPFVPQVGLVYVRGCEVEGMLDKEGRLIEEWNMEKPDIPGISRTYRVWLDPNQYQQDMEANSKGAEDVYETFNVIMRRKPKENNFKAVLETIRNLMNIECVVPDWLHDIILGYGDPASAHYSNLPNQIETMDWNDTFLDFQHLVDSFPGCEIVTPKKDEDPLPPYRIRFPLNEATRKRKYGASAGSVKNENVLHVQPHIIPSRGPYPYNRPKRNTIRFTPTQIEAIRSGMQPGLTMVVGPPGTGKTDVAVQIISNIYHNFPDQRTLIVTHSNQALNQLFEKIIALDVDERHLLRMGHGEEALETEKDFSRYGRVDYVLAKRLELLDEVARLKDSLQVPGDVAYTCETAQYFYLYHVLARWEEFLSKVKTKPNEEDDIESIEVYFPFDKFFTNAPQPLFKGKTYQEDFEIAEGCFRYVKSIFTQLDEFRAFELLRTGSDRTKYLLIREAKIIAMTCTHAALKRSDLVELGFQFDNILMEESAQILEIETFIPLLLQNPQHNINRLKRWIMIGDHHQLPPVIKNMAFQKYSNMEQSLFTRFVRLGVPTVDLDAQGRARPSLCNLYNWRYKKLGNLQHTFSEPEYLKANPGFWFDYQLIDVGNFNGVGESEPNPHFYQNLAEAEYVCGVFMYMRLLGYPAEKISVLTTYNGQKHLIRDVIAQRCADNPLIGTPSKVTTVDRFQGQQNDYILLSLVRTKTVGHLRDVRRLVVAMSRARLGLYVFARVSLFHNCFELTPTFNLLTQRPLKLHLAPHEFYPAQRPNDAMPSGTPMICPDVGQMHAFVYDFYKNRVAQLNKGQAFGVVEESPQFLSAEQTESNESSGKPASDAGPSSLEPDEMAPAEGIPTGDDVPLEDEEMDDKNKPVEAMAEHPGADSDSDEEKGGDLPSRSDVPEAAVFKVLASEKQGHSPPATK